MNYRKLTTTFAFILLASLLVFGKGAFASEITGTLSAGSTTGNSGSGTISGTVGGGTGSSGGGGGGGSSGSVLGASTMNLGSTSNIPAGQVLGVSTPGFPTTGTSLLSYLDSVLLVLVLTVLLFTGYRFYHRPKRNVN